jgi:hypothetical protein|tara:strand:- start:1014 stop:1454 length:441 start_codon:yes stop_codon:yes gene_type:complete
MKIKCFILLLILSSCFSSEEPVEKIKSFDNNLDSLFRSADEAVNQVNSRKEQKTLLEQELWRKDRDIKAIKKTYTDSIWNISDRYERSTMRMGDDSCQYQYKIVMQTIVDTVRVIFTDTICNVCETKQNKKDNRWYKKTFRWIKNI